MPAVSVIIPSYNYASFIAQCINSVLDQTFTDFELIVVDDGSQDDTAAVVQQFSDPRVTYLYQDNKGLPGARNTGIRASTGKYLAFLDSDDIYHPRKLEIQVAYLEANEQIGLAYNSRFLVDSEGQILRIRKAPPTADLADLVTGYPFAPSDVVMRREWAERVGLFDESFVRNSEDLNFHIRLLLAGCTFGGVPDVLAYRQIHTGRSFGDIGGKVATYLRALDTAFVDPNCPPSVLALRDQAYADHYLIWGYQALIQGEVALGQELLQQALALHPGLLADQAKPLRRFLVHNSLRDGGDHETVLRCFWRNAPETVQPFRHLEESLITRGTMIRGIREVMWGREAEGVELVQRAAAEGARLDDEFIKLLQNQLANVSLAYNMAFSNQLWNRLRPYLLQLGTRAQVHELYGRFAFDQAFHQHHQRNFEQVPAWIFRAVRHNPRHLGNKGLWSILLQAILRMRRNSL